MRLLLAPVMIAAALQAPPAPGFTVTLDGGIFKNQTFTLKPLVATYANNNWRSTRDPRINRLSLESILPPDGLGIHFDAAPRAGTTAYDRKDEDDPNRNPYMRFELRTADWTAAKGYRFDLVHVDVTVAKLDDPGGRIEGTFVGSYELCTLPGNGGGNCTARTPLKIDGRFSVVRARDRVVD
jgi:hypothetical protein